MEFRKLRADEIDARVAQIKENGLSLLLYKDARCDMRILDETVGAYRWRRSHQLIDGQLFCTVEIYDSSIGEWVGKQDVGVESQTEAEKGRASDSFKRACFNWGIGRELYTAPFIWIPAGNYSAKEDRGKWKTFDKFKVTSIGYEGESISQLTIINQKTGRKVFEFGARVARGGTLDPDAQNPTPEPVKPRETAPASSGSYITEHDWNVLKQVCTEKGISPEEVLHRYGFDPKKPSTVTVGAYGDMIKAIAEGRLV